MDMTRIPQARFVCFLITLPFVAGICAGQFTVPYKLLLLMAILLLSVMVDNVFRSLLYLALSTLALPLDFFHIPLVSYYSVSIGLSDALILILFLILVGHKSFQREIRVRANSITFPLLILLVAALVSLVGAKDRRMGMIYLLVMLEGFVLYSYILTFFTSEKDLRRLLIVYFIIASFYGVYAVCQFKFGRLPLIGGKEISTFSELSINRIGANFTHPNSLSGFIVLALPLMYVSLAKGRTLWNTWLCVSLCTLVFALGVTYSRNGYVAFVLSTLVIAALHTRKYNLLKVSFLSIAGLFAVFGVANIYMPSVIDRMLTVRHFQYDMASVGRLMFWRNCLKSFASNPFTGIGISNFYHEPYSLGFLGPHNLYLSTLAELGVFGFLGLLMLLVTIVKQLLKNHVPGDFSFLGRINMALIASWMAFLSHNLFDSVWGIISHSRQIKYLWVFIAITILTIQLSNRRKILLRGRQ